MSQESISIGQKSRSPLKEIKLPELARSPTVKHKRGYSIFKESIIHLLRQKPIPPWKQLDGIKPSGY
ncbi:unnamed protein product [Blepharisma stoltei]|uniref:Uncharacterized protein n=1 Tax=Blepharisma stoltei TaxID=1481888 RepID=A0AAU9JLV2_9CILI|nr:unnamed protein product [Blepharisma stoltei]